MKNEFYHLYMMIHCCVNCKQHHVLSNCAQLQRWRGLNSSSVENLNCLFAEFEAVN